MPLPQYSPWQEAGAGVNRLGNTFNDLMMEVAKQRYAQSIRQQQLALQAAALKQREEATRSQVEADKARAGRANAASAIDTEKLGSAKRFGSAMGRQVPTVNPLELGEGPSRNAARVMNDQDAFVQAVMEAATLAGLSGNPQRASTFQADQEALRSVQPMSKDLGAAMLTGTRSHFPVPAGSGVYDVMDQVINQIVPGKPSAPRTGVPPVLTPSAALEARTSLGFEDLPVNMQQVIDATITNAPTRGASAPVGQPMAAPQAVPPPNQRPAGFTTTTAKGTFRWNGQSWEPVR